MKLQTLALREALATFWWIALIVILGFVAAYQFVEPAPPHHADNFHRQQ